MKFISKWFQESLSVRGVHLNLTPLYHQYMNGQVKLTWKTLRTIVHSIMVKAQVSYDYKRFTLMYTTHHIFLVLPINHLVNQDVELNTPQKMATVTKPSVSNLRVIFCTFFVQE